MYHDIRKLLEDIRDNWKNIQDRIQYASSRFFYKGEFINELLFNRNFENLPKNEFINYGLAFQYYAANRKKIRVERRGEQKEIELPYQELINFIEHPQAKIHIEQPIQTYFMSTELLDETEPAFQEFRKQRPNTKNGNILRISSLQQESTHQFRVKLEKAQYYDLVRTNLSLDHPLKYDNFSSLRIRDLGETNSIQPIEASQMVNSIGVSTVLTYHHKGSFHFYMKPRRGRLGIFNNMLSSISGVVEPPLEEIHELTTYVARDIMRELEEETGLTADRVQSSPQFQLIPLAFTRELMRGGKPQFFFLMLIEKIDEREFKKLFNKSEAEEEFKDDWYTNIKSFDDFISPEFTTNLMYALQYIQKKQRKETEVLNLD